MLYFKKKAKNIFIFSCELYVLLTFIIIIIFFRYTLCIFIRIFIKKQVKAVAP